MKKILTAIFSFVLFSYCVNAQGPGYIIRETPTGTARTILDPNNDRWVSSTNSGFVGNDDVTNSEIAYKPLYPYSAEPYGDLRRGPDHKFSDFVPGIDNASYYMYYRNTSGSEALQFRMRMGSVMPGAKGYSILIDTDGKFGPSGPNADSNYIAATTGTGGNPGFEIEIVLATGGGEDGVLVYNVDGTQSPLLLRRQSGWTNYSQIAIAATNDNADPDFYLDFYVDQATLTAAGITTSTQMRVVPTTVMAPTTAIGGPKSDIYGLSDDSYNDPSAQYEAFINAQSSFTLNNLSGTSTTSPAPAICTAAPTLNTPITTGATFVSGTWTRSSLTGAVNTATIKLYKNGTLLPQTTTVTSTGTSATWTVSGLTALANNDSIVAKAVATGETECLRSNSVKVNNCNSGNIPATPVLACTNGTKGTESATASFPSGYTLNVQNITTGSAVETATYAGSGGTTFGNIQFAGTGAGPFSWKWQSGCGGSPVSQGQYKIWYSNSAGCISEPVYYCSPGNGGSSWTSTTVNITNPSVSGTPSQPITTATQFILGTATAGSTLRLYIDKQLSQSQALSAGVSNFSFNTPNLRSGQSIYVVDELNASACAAATSSYIVKCFTATPSITADANSQLLAGQPITGASAEVAGTTIRVYTSTNTLISTTTVQANGTWSTNNSGSTPTNYVAVSGTSYYATAQNGSCGESIATSNYTAQAQTSSARCGAITSTMPGGTLSFSKDVTSVSGTLGTTSATSTVVRLYQDGSLVDSSASTTSSSWSIVNLTGKLYAGGVLTIGIKEGTNAEVSCPTSYTVTCTPPATPTYSFSSCSSGCNENNVQPGSTLTYSVSNATVGNFYSLRNAITGQSLSKGVWATSTSFNITTIPLTNGGSYSIQLVGSSVSAAEVCSVPTTARSYTVLPVELVDFKATRINNANELKWKTSLEVNASHFEIEKKTDANEFKTIGQVKASGNQAGYSFIDKEIEGAIIYYRLKMVDLDGRYKYSKVVSLRNGTNVILNNVHPNPFYSELNVSLSVEKKQVVQIFLIDGSGRTVYQNNQQVDIGVNDRKIDHLSSLPKGIYLIKIQTIDGIIHQKLLK